MADTASASLVLDGGDVLAIVGKDLILLDSAVKSGKEYRSPGARTNGKRTIPLYNILWASLSKTALLIEYVPSSLKTLLKHKTWSLKLACSDDASGETSPETFVAALISHAYGSSQPRKRAYVLINPHAGPGNALRQWHNEVRPLFEAARMELDVVTLTRGGEAAELATSVDIDKYDTIVACSGDGTPHEIFNGLGKRPDAMKALRKIAVSHIPCGSGNAMSCNLFGSHRPSVAALALIKSVVTPLDLVSISQGSRRTLSFLSQALGIVAESDLGTENLRWMGGARFELGILMRVFRQRCYPCDLAVKVEVEKESVKAHYKHHLDSNASKKSQSVIQDDVSLDVGSLPPLKYGTIKDDLPAGWELISYDKIGNFYCGNMAFMAANTNFFPAAAASDGCMDLVTINGDLSPVTAGKILLSVEKNKLFDNPHVSYRKISAYRIIPRNQEDGFISVDGEKMPFEPFQAEIHQGLGRVLSKNGGFETDGPLNWQNAT